VRADQQKIKDKKLRGKVQKLQKRFGEFAYNAARSEMLLPTDRGFLEVEGMEKTYKVRQGQLLKQVDITTAQKVSMVIFGAYCRDLSSNFLNSVLIRLTIPEMEGICYSAGERVMLRQWIGGKDAYIVNSNSRRRFEL
jgi:hypothetical protein